MKSQRTPRDFKVSDIKATRELRRDAAYAPEFVNVPITLETLNVSLSAEEDAMLEALALPVYGADRGAALRDIFFTWWEERFLGAAQSGAPAVGDHAR